MLWIIMRRGMYYRPEFSGYTEDIVKAGFYDEKAAKSRVDQAAGVSAHPASEFIDQIDASIVDTENYLDRLKNVRALLSQKETEPMEDLHKQMFAAHWNIFQTIDGLHKVATALYARGRFNDERQKYALALKHIESARNLAGQLIEEAGRGRTELIRVTGCDGTCTNPAKDVET